MDRIKLIFFALVFFFPLNTICQVTIEGSDSEPQTVLTPGGSASIDIGDNAIRASYNNLRPINTSEFLFGITGEVAAKDKIGTLFSGNGLASGASLVSYIGVQFPGKYDKENIGKDVQSARSSTTASLRDLLDLLGSQIIEVIKNSDKVDLTDSDLVNLKDNIEREKQLRWERLIMRRLNPKPLNDSLLTYSDVSFSNLSEKKDIIESIYRDNFYLVHFALVNNDENNNLVISESLKTVYEDLQNTDATDLTYVRSLIKPRITNYIYGIFGGSGIEASWLSSNDIPLANAVDTSSTAWLAGLGYSQEIGTNWRFGFAFTFGENNNLGQLPSRTFKQEFVSVNVSNDSLTTINTSREIESTVKVGSWDKYKYQNLRADLIYFVTPAKSLSYMALHFYPMVLIRNKPSLELDDKAYITSLGFATYFFNKGNFVGGAYAEFRDIFKGVNENNGLDDYHDSGLKVGIVAKWTLTSITELMAVE